ncbi:hypothetical protein [Halovivax limisalsi]|uniref:hypothetical protein n=1 Tax=Halovivax limisalsi TaxID=1453760 RepID=UPI001FFC5F13|nr:hypothetical protein [Halovivax limisalsi]
MQRREILGAFGTVGTGTIVASRLADGSNGDTDDDSSGRPAESRSAETQDGNAVPADREWTGETHEVGDPAEVPFPGRNTPHEVEVRNGSDESRRVSVAVSADDGDRDRSFEATADLDPTETRRVVLHEPGTYVIDLGTDDDRVVERIGHSWFDCNESKTTAEVESSGVDVRSLSTSVACRTPRVKSSTVERTDAGCAGGESNDRPGFDGRTSISCAERAVVIEGTIIAPTPCHDVTLQDVTYDAGRDDLQVTVASREPSGDGGCIQCEAALEYVATVEFERGFPGSVDVEHADVNGTTLGASDGESP